MTSKKILALTLSLTWLLCAPVDLSAQQLKIATLAPDGSTWMEGLNEAARAIEADTEQRVSIRYYPGGVMGDAQAILRRMRLGQLQGGAFTIGDLAEIDGVANLYSLPFVFRDVDEIQALRSTYDPLILAALEEGGLIVPALSLGGFAYLFGREPFPDPDQMDAGWRVWVQPGDLLSAETLTRLGVSAVPLPLAEVYTALQTGAINTFGSTPSAAIILQWHTRARHMLDLPVLMTGGTIGLDPRSMGRLSSGDRASVLARFSEALAALESSNLRENIEARAALVDQGLSIDPASAAQIETWRAEAEGTRAELLERGRIEIPHLEAMLADLEAVRADP